VCYIRPVPPPEVPLDTPAIEAAAPPPAGPGAELTTRVADRVASLIEVVLCSGFPTQLVVMLGLAMAGLQPFGDSGELSLRYVTSLSLIDTALLLALVFAFVTVRGERPAALFLDDRRVAREAVVGLLWLPVVLLVVGGLSLAINQLAPWLRTVPENPLASLLRNPRDAAVFAVVVVVAGGVREEIQRAFILDRFERHLGGALTGLGVFSLVFGLGHALQGWDAVLLTATLGVIWGALYLARRSVVAPIVCHAAFNLAQVLYHFFQA